METEDTKILVLGDNEAKVPKTLKTWYWEIPKPWFGDTENMVLVDNEAWNRKMQKIWYWETTKP